MQIFVALGGNALLKRGDPMNTEVQLANVRIAARALAPVARQHRLVVSHGNGPQAGLLALQATAYDGVPPYPLNMIGAATEGMIGYMLEQELGNLLGYDVPVATLLTRTVVDPKDPAFANPTKFVGPGYDQAAAQAEATRHGWTFKQDGARWRRVVPSPQPKAIVWHRPIRWLLENGSVVICAGGGGIPCKYLPDGKTLVGVEAVIDKDRAGALLASELPADLFVIATDVDGVYLDWGTPQQRLLRQVTPDQLSQYAFTSGSMGPKVEAACDFVRRTGQRAVIGSLEHLQELIEGSSGTIVQADP
ncbi:MAG: carbamate kinase [Pseudomonas sp.]